VNNNILYDSQALGAGTVSDQQFASEIINYVILQTASESITTGETAVYSMICNIRGNGAFWQNPFDTLANNLFTNSTSSSMDPTPGALKTVEPNHLNDHKAPAGKGSIFQRIGNVMKKAGQAAWKHKDAIFGGMEMLAPLLLAGQQPHLLVTTNQTLLISVDYKIALERVIRSLKKLEKISQIPISYEMDTLLFRELQRVQAL